MVSAPAAGALAVLVALACIPWAQGCYEAGTKNQGCEDFNNTRTCPRCCYGSFWLGRPRRFWPQNFTPRIQTHAHTHTLEFPKMPGSSRLIGYTFSLSIPRHNLEIAVAANYAILFDPQLVLSAEVQALGTLPTWAINDGTFLGYTNATIPTGTAAVIGTLSSEGKYVYFGTFSGWVGKSTLVHIFPQEGSIHIDLTTTGLFQAARELGVQVFDSESDSNLVQLQACQMVLHNQGTDLFITTLWGGVQLLPFGLAPMALTILNTTPVVNGSATIDVMVGHHGPKTSDPVPQILKRSYASRWRITFNNSGPIVFNLDHLIWRTPASSSRVEAFIPSSLPGTHQYYAINFENRFFSMNPANGAFALLASHDFPSGRNLCMIHSSSQGPLVLVGPGAINDEADFPIRLLRFDPDAQGLTEIIEATSLPLTIQFAYMGTFSLICLTDASYKLNCFTRLGRRLVTNIQLPSYETTVIFASSLNVHVLAVSAGQPMLFYTATIATNTVVDDDDEEMVDVVLAQPETLQVWNGQEVLCSSILNQYWILNQQLLELIEGQIQVVQDLPFLPNQWNGTCAVSVDQYRLLVCADNTASCWSVTLSASSSTNSPSRINFNPTLASSVNILLLVKSYALLATSAGTVVRWGFASGQTACALALDLETKREKPLLGAQALASNGEITALVPLFQQGSESNLNLSGTFQQQYVLIFDANFDFLGLLHPTLFPVEQVLIREGRLLTVDQMGAVMVYVLENIGDFFEQTDILDGPTLMGACDLESLIKPVDSGSNPNTGILTPIPSTSGSSSFVTVLSVVIPVVAFLLLLLGLVVYRQRTQVASPHRALMQALEMARDDFVCANPSLKEHDLADVRWLQSSDVMLMEELGRGAFGQVHKAIWQTEKGPLTVAYKRNTANQEGEVTAVLHEVLALHSLRSCPYIVKLLGLAHDPASGGGLALVLEYASGSDLRSSLMASPVWQKSRQIQCALEVAHAIAYLHEHNVIHRDLAARNVLVFEAEMEDGHTRFSLFRSSNVMSRGMPSRYCSSQEAHCRRAAVVTRFLPTSINYYNPSVVKAMPFRWQAPEALVEQKHALSSDMWSFGVLMWEIAQRGARPYADISEPRDVVGFLRRGHRLAFDPHTSPATIVRLVHLTPCAGRQQLHDTELVI
ncbi:uncharacterized protein MONBRDRAFT_25791 [Monosiga brevicollis MX1]|uniref:Protein kinase domain-containing protein n=1 Tax=Monosiga brevicollis TaxID=81824 RepID=A9V0F8_MONBE|nr:uncharacterized protein MONBRDRAFT_25791 [Monosiga brevicollis MX1]EDQ89149.1 predicted protein [Monosiga brevicollis MX1]|eukprot:XP_001746254.1 hypothetical protein [Monosiga brevicollis MX1]